jgi:hypothetical protein
MAKSLLVCNVPRYEYQRKEWLDRFIRVLIRYICTVKVSTKSENMTKNFHFEMFPHLCCSFCNLGTSHWYCVYFSEIDVKNIFFNSWRLWLKWKKFKFAAKKWCNPFLLIRRWLIQSTILKGSPPHLARAN